MMSNTLSREERIKVLDEAFVSLMWIVKQQISQRLQRFGLTHPQFIVLSTLATHGRACTMSDLTGATLQDPPTMTGIIDRLVKMKLVQRTRSEVDRRVVLAEATTKGIELVKSIEDERLRDHTTGYGALTDEDLSVLEQLLKYVLRMQIGRYKSLPEDELNAEIEKLRVFNNDPIGFAKLHIKS